MGAPGRKDDHDYMKDEEIANFLRGPSTGTGNNGRRAIGRFINEAFQLSRPPTVLDAACGTGVNWETFKGMGVKCDYTGMDRTGKMLDHMRKLYGDEINIVEGFVQELPFEDNSFDLVIMRHIMEHLPDGDMEKAIAEGIRVASKEFLIVFFLKPDGREDHDICENQSNEGRDGCTHFWNTYSHVKLMNTLMSFGYEVKYHGTIYTQGAAHGDTIYRIAKV